MTNKKLQAVRGTHDIFPEEARVRRQIVETWRRVAELYGYGEIQTPIFEFSEVFHRTLGDTSDVVAKETYTFEDRGGESLTLRPEFTASVVRAFLNEGRLQNELPVKFYYYGPAFRYERPQKGRLRQFHQIGAELLGVADADADAEMIALARQFLDELGLGDAVELQLNTLGDAKSRAAYREELVKYFAGHESRLSEDSRERLHKNPLRILDSKDEGDRELVKDAPEAFDYFTQEAKDFYRQVKDRLEAFGVQAVPNSRLVRGLDYYNHTVFEFVATEGLGAQNTVLAGGRYDGLVEQLGGSATPGIGFAAGVERLLAVVEELGLQDSEKNIQVAVVPRSADDISIAWKITQDLRHNGVSAEMDYSGNLGKRMKRAEKKRAFIVALVGSDVAIKLRDGGPGLICGHTQVYNSIKPYLEQDS